MPESQTPPTLAARKILVVDDEPVIIIIFQKILTGAGAYVEVAEDAEKAWALFGAQRYDLVLTDFGLPRMNGLTLARMMKERSPNQPIVLVTGMLEQIKREGLSLAPVDFVVEKPFSARQLLEACAGLLPPGEQRR